MEKKEYSVLQNMFYVMKGTFSCQRSLIGYILVSLITAAILPFLPSITLKVAIGQIEEGAPFLKFVQVILLVQVVRLVLRMMDSYATSMKWWRYIDARMQFMLRHIRKVVYMDFEYLESPQLLDCCQKAMQATNNNDNGVEGMMHSFEQALTTLVQLIVAMSALVFVSPLLVVFLVFLTLLNFVSMDYTKKQDKEKTWDALAPYGRKEYYMRTAATNFNYAKEVRLFAMKDWLLRKYEALHRTMHRMFVESKNRWIACGMINQVLTLVQQIGVYAYLIYCVLQKDMSIANFSLYLGITQTLFNVLSTISNGIATLRQQSRQVSDFRSFLEYEVCEENVGEEGAYPKEALIEEKELFEAKAYEFIFEDVSFKYPETDRYALRHLNLTLKPGERLAVVGLNGAGKTTFIKLLCRLYTPTEGRILLNGKDIQSIDRRAYYMLFAPVFQNIEVFAFSMAENVAMKMGDEVNEVFAKACLEMAGLGEKLETLSEGVKTQLLKVIYEDGIDLSGGEKQKLAFTRALYKDAPIVLLDEPTSALDALAEYRLYQEFDELIGSKSAVYISHRLSSTRFCDHIAMFEGGELVEYGSHDSLLEKGGAYGKMFEVQAQYYKEEGGMVDEAF